MFIATESIPSSFRGFTLIMPAVSVGNVGQLATDLIISTLGMPRVGYIYTDCLIPMAGNNPYTTCADDAAELNTNAEVYCLPGVKLAVLQIRAPFVQRKSRKFRKLIVSWIKSSGFDRTVVLSSSHAYQRDDQQLLGAPLRYLLSPVLEHEAGTQLNTLEWKEMERVSAFPGINDSDKRLYIPGGGITKGLYTDGCSEGIKMAVLLIFCSEGDNIPDAFALVNYLNDWLHLVDKPPDVNPVEGPRVLEAAFRQWDPPCDLLNLLSCVVQHMAEARMLPTVCGQLAWLMQSTFMYSSFGCRVCYHGAPWSPWFKTK